jgi:hydrogenase nickel incorporation protein HypA/HybF
MHEAAAVQGMCSAVLEHAQAAGAKRVTSIELTLGAAGHLTEEVIRQHFELLAAGTLAEGARLAIHWLPATFQCFSCLSRFQSLEHSGETAICPKCSGTALEIAHEDVYYVSSIDVE